MEALHTVGDVSKLVHRAGLSAGLKVGQAHYGRDGRKRVTIYATKDTPAHLALMLSLIHDYLPNEANLSRGIGPYGRRGLTIELIRKEATSEQ